MTAVDTWLAPSWRDPGGEELHAFLQCDVCWPPLVMCGTAKDLAECDWSFSDFEHGPHVCPICPRGRRARRRLSPPSRNPVLPNMIVVGAEKSGTTSLHHYLRLHPEVAMAQDKELNFFQDPACLEQLDDYSLYFDSRKPLRGEACPTYTVHPLMPGALERMRTAVPEAKLVYIVRDPVERAIADYAQFSRLWQRRPIEKVFTNLDHPYHAYMAPGRYATQLRRCYKSFPTEQVLVLDQADLLKRRRQTLRTLFAFLDVDPDFDSPHFDQLANTRDSVPVSSPRRRRLTRSPLGAAVRQSPPLIRRPLVAAGNRLTALGTKPPSVVVDDDLRTRLRDANRQEAAELRAMTGIDFASWQV